MKNILLFVFTISFFSSFGQDGIFFQPLVGGGIGNIKWTGIPGGAVKTKFRPCYEIQFGVGYLAKKTIFSVAVGYKQSSYGYSGTATDFFGNPIGQFDYTYTYSHISLLMTIGHRLYAGKHFWLSPSVGAIIAYNYASRVPVSISSSGQQLKMGRIPNNEFKQQYKPISAWGVIQVNMDFVVTSRLCIAWAPSFDYMVTGMNKRSSGGVVRQHNYTFMLNGGIKWFLHNAGNTETNRSKTHVTE